MHCSQDVFSGLTYVAASRVKSDNHLQLKNFNLNFLLAPPTEVLSQTASYLGKVHPSKSCCPHKQLKEELFEASDPYTKSVLSEGADEDFQIPNVNDMVANLFKKEGVHAPEDLVNVYGTINQNESQFATPPESLNVYQLLSSFAVEEPSTNNEQQKNETIHQLHTSLESNNVQPFVFSTLVSACCP